MSFVIFLLYKVIIYFTAYFTLIYYYVGILSRINLYNLYNPALKKYCAYFYEVRFTAFSNIRIE